MRVKRDYRQTARETYDRWKKDHPNVDLTYAEWQGIIYSFNYAFRDYLLETGEIAKLPWGMGDFAISKVKPKKEKKTKTGETVIGLPVDWKKTRALGKKVYHLNRHTDGYKFYLRWFITTARFKMYVIWSFKPSRTTSRLINHYIKQDPTNQFKYQDWRLVKK